MIVEAETVELLDIASDVRAVIDRLRHINPDRIRPCVTLTYAQSLDGSIAGCTGAQTGISGTHALDCTHRLRAMHDAILVGINTVMTDDPQLTVRRVAGRNPRPVIVDSQLRIPLGCRVIQRRDATPIIATTRAADAEKAALLAGCGADIWYLPATSSGSVDLSALLKRLGEEGIGSVMVEGGARIITSIVASGLADQLLVTISPRLLGGIRALGLLDGQGGGRRELGRVRYLPAGDDLLVHGEFA